MLCWRVQGLGPRARIPRGPSSFVQLNPSLGAGRGRRRKCIPPQTLLRIPPTGEGGQMGARRRACLSSQPAGDTQGPVSRKLKTKRHSAFRPLPDTLILRMHQTLPQGNRNLQHTGGESPAHRAVLLQMPPPRAPKAPGLHGLPRSPRFSENPDPQKHLNSRYMLSPQGRRRRRSPWHSDILIV